MLQKGIHMKIFIWFMSIFVASSIKIYLEVNGFYLGFLWTFILYIICFSIAHAFCKCLDDENVHKNKHEPSIDDKFKNNDSFMKWIHGESNDNQEFFKSSDNTISVPPQACTKKKFRFLNKLFGFSANLDSVTQLVFKDENEIITEICKYHKKILKRFLILTTAVVTISCISASIIAYNIGQNNTQKLLPDTSPIVYVTTSGQKYHRENCRYVRGKDNTLEISINQAEEKGYSPCSKCKPEKLKK